MAWKESSPAMPCWMLLITAISAARCSVSFSRRCVSSNRRAFSSATPMLEATVVSKRISASPYACSRTWFSRRQHTRQTVARKDRDEDNRERAVGARHQADARSVELGGRVVHERSAGLAHPAERTAGHEHHRRDLQPLAVLVLVQKMEQAGLRIDQANADVLGLQHRAQLVAHEVDDGLEFQRPGHALLDAVDDGELACALLQLGGALGHLAFQPRGEAHVGERQRRLGRQHAEELHVAVVESAVESVDVGVDEAQKLALREKRHDERALLVDGLGLLGQVAQRGAAGAARFLEPWADVRRPVPPRSRRGAEASRRSADRLRLPAPAARAPRRRARSPRRPGTR